MKEQLLIVTHHLTVGGVQKTLIPALTAIDYDRYDVTLYLRKNRIDLLPYIDKRVRVVINQDYHHYYRKPACIVLQARISLCRLLKKEQKAAQLEQKLSEKICLYGMQYEHKTYFANTSYDKAIAYVHGYAAQFVSDYVTAQQKYVFFHSSTDELRDVHLKVIHNFHKVVALHQMQKELIGQWYPQIADRIVLVENYVDGGMVRSQAQEYGVEKPIDKTVLCTCGRMTPVKGFDLAVKSAKILKENGVDFLWYFVGDGPQRKEIETLIAQCDLQNEIRLVGMQTNPYPYMNACDLYVQPSYEEAMPVTILEAKKLNKPIITTATVGGKKLVADGINGLVCDIAEKSLADKILFLANNEIVYRNMVSVLENTDGTEDFEKYKKQWRELLEG